MQEKPEKKRKKRRDLIGRKFPPKLRFFLGMAILILYLFFRSWPIILSTTPIFALLCILSGKRISLLYFFGFLISITFFHLFIPEGKVLITILQFPVTEGALLAGVKKALTILGMVYISLFSVSRDLKLPGTPGMIFAWSMKYFDSFYQAKGSVKRKTFFEDIDRLLFKLFPLIFIILFIQLPTPLAADDGSWSNSFSLNSGHIYSEVNHPHITLEKELLVFDGETTSVWFQFKNTSPEPQQVTCGFPVKLVIDAYFHDDGYLYIPVGKYDKGNMSFLRFFDTEPNPNPNDENPPEYYHEKIPVSPENNLQTMYSPGGIASGVQFSIAQNGKPVPVDEILLERHAGREGAWVTFHHKHKLEFGANETIQVKVVYSYDMFQAVNGGVPMGDSYSWDYIIGTGGTWQGPIGEIIVIKPSSWKGALEGLNQIAANRNVEIYHQSRYIPRRDEQFNLNKTYYPVPDYKYHAAMVYNINFMDIEWLSPPGLSYGSPIRDVRATSALDQRVDVFSESGRITGANFSGQSLFDGYDETAWCEAVPGDGLGKRVDFTVTGPCWGFSLRNGFNRLPYGDSFFRTELWIGEYLGKERELKDYYLMNNRLKSVILRSSDGNIDYRFSLPDSRNPIDFPGIYIPPGQYSLIIDEVYKGTAWDDTCVSELTFFPVSNTPKQYSAGTLETLFNDPFYKPLLENVRIIREPLEEEINSAFMMY